MTKSLNQAFIKAYTKDKANEAHGPSASHSPDSLESLMVRFDTATCAIPAQHPVTEVRRRVESFVSPGASERLQQPAVARRASAADADRVHPATSDLRHSIASQMVSAGVWEDQQIDAFIGGFPMSSPAQLKNNSLRPSEPQATVAGLQHKAGPQDDPPLMRNPSSVATPSAADSTQPEQPVGGRGAMTAELAASQASREAAPLTSSQTLPTANFESAATAAAAVHSPELPAPNAPALLTDDQRLSESQTPGNKPGFKVSDEERIRTRPIKGGIFRLDRPTYAADSVPRETAELADSSEQSSIIASLSGSHTNLDLESDAARVTASSKSAVGQTREVEEGLRRARVRIFNPVWEVDCFQWPDICVELLEQRASNMEKVAQNLVSACQEGLQVLAITSPQSGEGRTTVACCLAKLAGSRGLNVAIVDGDIENPTLSYQTNLDVEQDWKTAIFNQLPLEEIAVHSINDQVTLVPLVNPIGHHEMSTDDDRVAFMLRELSESFDLVIVDMGHMNSTRSLVTSMSEQGIISAIVAVVDHRCSSPQQVEACLRRIRQTGVTSIGLVENFAA